MKMPVQSIRVLPELAVRRGRAQSRGGATTRLLLIVEDPREAAA